MVKKFCDVPVQHKRGYKAKNRQIFAANCRNLLRDCRELPRRGMLLNQVVGKTDEILTLVSPGM